MKAKQNLIALLMLFSASVLAASGGEENRTISYQVSFEIKDQIVRAINQPVKSLNLMGDKELILDFYVNSNNQMVVNGIETNNGFLAMEIKKMLEGHKIYTRNERKNQPYRLKLKFVK